MGQHVAFEVNAAALPRSTEPFGDGGLDAVVRVRDHQFTTPQTTAARLAAAVRINAWSLEISTVLISVSGPSGMRALLRGQARWPVDLAQTEQL